MRGGERVIDRIGEVMGQVPVVGPIIQGGIDTIAFLVAPTSEQQMQLGILRNAKKYGEQDIRNEIAKGLSEEDADRKLNELYEDLTRKQLEIYDGKMPFGYREDNY